MVCGGRKQKSKKEKSKWNFVNWSKETNREHVQFPPLPHNPSNFSTCHFQPHQFAEETDFMKIITIRLIIKIIYLFL